MVSLSKFRVDSKAVEAGEWVFPDPDLYDELEIKTKGWTDQYTDARAAKMRRASQHYNNDTTRVPISIARDILVDCLIKYVVLDVRGISNDKGAPVLFPEFCDLLRNSDYADLVSAVIKAAAIVGLARDNDKIEATENLSKP